LSRIAGQRIELDAFTHDERAVDRVRRDPNAVAEGLELAGEGKKGQHI
jgi:hypothetical protein